MRGGGYLPVLVFVCVPCASIKVISDLSSISALVLHPMRIRSLSSWSRYPRLMYLSTE